ncbi:MAG: hypothetical protein QXT77_07535 [Candidatus Methanomethylicaceae archaeon]
MSIAGDIISGVTGLAGTLASNASARNMQRRQIRKDVEFWHMQNEYNSPQAQMKRLKEAGLNPNLIYGSSPGGAAGTADRLKTPDVDPAAHRFIDGVMPTLSQYGDFNVKQAQTDNLKAQTQVAQENAILTAQRAYGEGIRNARTSFDLKLAEDLYHTSLDSAREQLRKLKIDNQYRLNEDERANIALSNNTMQAVESVLRSRIGRQLTKAQIANVRADNELKRLDAKLAAMGIRPSDPFYASAIARIIQKFQQKFGY